MKTYPKSNTQKNMACQYYTQKNGSSLTREINK